MEKDETIEISKELLKKIAKLEKIASGFSKRWEELDKKLDAERKAINEKYQRQLEAVFDKALGGGI